VPTFEGLTDDQLAAASVFVFDHSRVGAEAQYNNNLGEKFRYILGAQGLFNKTNTDQTSNWDFDGPISQTILSVYAHGELDLGDKFRTIASLRMDHENTIGATLSPKLALVYDVNDDSAWRLTYGRGFKYPTIQEQNAFILVHFARWYRTKTR